MDAFEKHLEAEKKLHDAAREFTEKWLKEPQDSSFREWSEACDKLGEAAVQYADSKRMANSVKYCDDPDHCTYSDCPTAFCDRKY